MTTCKTIRERMLEADATTLAGRGDSAVARHVRRCATCRSVAGRILDETGLLGAYLEQRRPRMNEAEAVRLARGYEGHRVGVEPPVTRRGRSPGVRRRWVRWAPVPVAAAATIATLVLTAGPRGQRVEEVRVSARVAPAAFAAAVPMDGLSVDIPEQGQVVVFETKNPSITVVWFY